MTLYTVCFSLICSLFLHLTRPVVATVTAICHNNESNFFTIHKVLSDPYLICIINQNLLRWALVIWSRFTWLNGWESTSSIFILFVFFLCVLEMKMKRSSHHSTDDDALWNEISTLRVKEILDGYFKLWFKFWTDWSSRQSAWRVLCIKCCERGGQKKTIDGRNTHDSPLANAKKWVIDSNCDCIFLRKWA